MSTPYFPTVFEYPIAEFKRHLSLDSNERIFFSARYGAGKTRFLQEFFQTDEAAAQYEVYHLFPVNYSISATEDIIKYIKYDIITAMLERGDDFAAESKSYLQTLPAFLLKRMDKVLAAIIAMIPEVGKSVLEMYERIEKLKDEYLAIHDAANAGPGDQLASYRDILEGQSGSLVENDVITRIIAGKVQSNRPKESVLILDDLDRLDPEHVFRILNVFAAHFDVRNGNGSVNKLGFDKVIIVCDIHNIRHIFHHRYGSQVDFAGYIDKFYSHDVFHFDNRPAVVSIVEQIVDSYICPDNTNMVKPIYFNDGFLIEILYILLRKGSISLRALLHTYGKVLQYHKEEVDLDGHGNATAWRIPMISKLKYLAELLGGADRLISVLEIFRREEIVLPNAEKTYGNCLYVLHYDRLKLSKNPTMISYGDTFYFLSPERSDLGRMISRVTMHIVNRAPSMEPTPGDLYTMPEREYWQLVIDAILRLQARGYIN